MLNKVIHPHNFKMDCSVSAIIDTFSKGIDKGWMNKRAAMFDDVRTDIKPEKGKTLCHLITTGALEAYGPNNNADGFNKKACEWTFPHPERGISKTAMLDGGLEKYHGTFMKRGYVYKHHQNNKDPKFASGMIKCEAYNPKMERGELIVSLDNDKWAEEIEKMAKEEPVYWSIGCCVPTDACSECGHRRRTKSESCGHIRDNLLQLTKEGHQIFAINDSPMFHDISGVFRPADKIAFSLRTLDMDKAASEGGVISSLDLAEAEGFYLPTSFTDNYVMGRTFNRLNTLRKLATMEEEIDKASDTVFVKEAFSIGSGFGEIDSKTMTKLAMNIDDSLGGMSKESVALPPESFFKLALGERFSEVQAHMPALQSRMPGLFREILASSDLDDFLKDGTYDGRPCLHRNIKEEISKLSESHSLATGTVQRRATLATLRNEPGKRPSGSTIQKTASEKADVLAREYGKYLLSFSKDKGEDTQRMVCVMKVS